jgi:uncharacterized membrane protein YheB (UPF0754 family)
VGELEKLPSVTEERIKEALDSMIKEFYKEHGVLPSKISLYLEGYSQFSNEKYTVLKPVMEIPFLL